MPLNRIPGGSLIWPFTSAIRATSGIFDTEGYFRTGRRPAIGQPLAEIYSLAEVDEDKRRWSLEEQQKLSRIARRGGGGDQADGGLRSRSQSFMAAPASNAVTTPPQPIMRYTARRATARIGR